MHGIGLLQGVSIKVVASGVAVDTSGYEGVCFVATATKVGAQTSHGDTSGAVVAAGAAGDLIAGQATEVHKPRKRWVSIDVASIALLYGPRTYPAANPAASRTLVSPETNS